MTLPIVPIASPRKKVETEWTEDRFRSSPRINRIRERKLFLCQLEAIETAIDITEVAPSCKKAWIENVRREQNASQRPPSLGTWGARRNASLPS